MPALTFGARLAQGAATSAIQGGMGLILGGINDRRQLKQQGKLLQQQQNADFQQMQYAQDLQYDMWQKTNYSAQMEQLKKAGLNPGLIYGMGGGSGATTGQTGTGTHSASAPSGGGEALGIMQLAAQQAQIELTKAQARKTEVETNKLETVDTQNVQAGTEEARSRTAINFVQKAILETENRIKNATAEETIMLIEGATREQHNRLIEAVRNNSIGDKLYETTIKQAQENLIQTGLENILLKTQNQLAHRQIYKISNEVAMGWKQLDLNEQQTVINRLQLNINQENADTQLRQTNISKDAQRFEQSMRTLTDHDKEMLDIITGILQAATLKGALKQTPQRNPIGFK